MKERIVPLAVMMVRVEDGTGMKTYPIVSGRCKFRDGMSGIRFRSGITLVALSGPFRP